MSQATPTTLGAEVESLRQADLLPFHELLDEAMVEAAIEAEGVTFKDRIYTPLVTTCLFLSQALDPDHSCRAAVARLVAWLAARGRPTCSPETPSYCEARKRLPVGVVSRLVHETARRADAEAGEGWLWKGRRAYLVDGTTVSMPDTPANQAAYPQSNSQRKGLGFPTARLVALISLATGVMRDLAMGPCKGKETGETALFRAMFDALEAGAVAVGDRYLASYFTLAELARRGADGLFRMHQRRKFDFRRGRLLGRGDHVVAWARPDRPGWMDESTYASIPDVMMIREIRYEVACPGFRVTAVVLATTLLDGEEYAARELADLYLRRWNIETDLRSIKCVLGMDVLRCMTPGMVEKEMWIHSLAYNLIHGVMAKAAGAHGVSPRGVSFKGALQTMTAFQDLLRGAVPAERRRLWGVMLGAIARHRVGDRFGRVEPRAIKRRPKPHRLLTEPRREARKRLLGAA